MPDTDIATWLGLIVLGGAALGALGRFVVMPIVRAIRFVLEQLETIAGHTKQLTTNGGEHLADVVRRTETVTLDNADKIKGFSDKWDEQQVALKTALEVQQTKVAADLKAHRSEVATEFADVWKEIATRDIHKSVDQLTEAADRAEAATPPRIEN